jgi:hypothetical protein
MARSITRILLLVLPALSVMAGSSGAASLWSDISPAAIPPAGERVIAPDHFRALTLDRQGMADFLSTLPLQESGARAVPIELPLPDGGYGRFAVLEYPMMAPELAARYPEIRTYAGRGLDDPTATVRLDMTPLGFHGLILSAQGSIYIDPFQRGDDIHYQSYYRRDFTSAKTLGGCTVIDEDGMGAEIDHLVELGVPRSGGQLRTYRAAVAADGEYTQYFGGTVALALAAINVSMNRVDGVYQREVAVHMVLVPNEDQIIFTDPATDPYTNENGSAMLNQNQATCDSRIGTANYDIGHVFSTGGGGIAYLGCVCRSGVKAKGVTGSPSPVGDPYDIDYVAHEMGHQFGGNHSFNSVTLNCGGGNRVGSAAYEPGSGSTVMSYAGICGADNLQWHSDDYFVWYSLQEIIAYTTQSFGNACPVITATGVVDPVPEAGLGGFTIPVSTPFELTGSAVTTGAPTYCWEESDLGPAGSPNNPSGNAPIFRSFDGVATPWRTFPKTSDLINNVHTIGELLPTYARSLSFKMTVRDFQDGGVGVAWDAISFFVAAVGPFTVTSPNTSVTWPAGSDQTVTWNVNGTDVAPVSCDSVNIYLSLDNGNSFPLMLAHGLPNNGSATVTLPFVASTHSRIKVKAADNVFFDISNTNFTIQDITGVSENSRSASGLELAANRPNPFEGGTAIRFEMPRAGEVALRLYDPAGRLVRTLVNGQLAAGSHQATWDGTDEGGRAAPSGVYLYRLSGFGEILSGRMTIIR